MDFWIDDGIGLQHDFFDYHHDQGSEYSKYRFVDPSGYSFLRRSSYRNIRAYSRCRPHETLLRQRWNSWQRRCVCLHRRRCWGSWWCVVSWVVNQWWLLGFGWPPWAILYLLSFKWHCIRWLRLVVGFQLVLVAELQLIRYWLHAVFCCALFLLCFQNLVVTSTSTANTLPRFTFLSQPPSFGLNHLHSPYLALCPTFHEGSQRPQSCSYPPRRLPCFFMMATYW